MLKSEVDEKGARAFETQLFKARQILKRMEGMSVEQITDEMICSPAPGATESDKITYQTKKRLLDAPLEQQLRCYYEFLGDFDRMDSEEPSVVLDQMRLGLRPVESPEQIAYYLVLSQTLQKRRRPQ